MVSCYLDTQAFYAAFRWAVVHRRRSAALPRLPRTSCFSVRLERRFSVPACDLTERRPQRPSREARSRAEPRAAAFCGEHGEHGEHWTLMAAAGGATLDQAGCIQTSAALGDHGYMGASFLIGSSRSSNSRSMRFAIPRCRSTSRGHARSRASAASVSSSFRLSRNRSE